MEELLINKYFNFLIGIYFGIIIYFTYYFTTRKFHLKSKIIFPIISVFAVIGSYVTIFLHINKIYSPILYLAFGTTLVIFLSILGGALIRKKRESYNELIKKRIEELIPSDVLQNLSRITNEKRMEIIQREIEIKKFEKIVKDAYLMEWSSYVRLGTYYYLKEDYKRAIDEWEIAYSQNPNIEALEYSIASAYLKMRDYQKALSWLEKSIKSKSDKFRFGSYFSKGWIYDELGQYEKAIDAYEEARKLDPDNVWVDYNEACTFAKMGRTKEALDKLKFIININDIKEEARNDPDFKNILENDELKDIFKKLVEE